MRVYVLDNSGELSGNLLTWLAENKNVTEVAFFDSSDEFLEMANETKPELAFIRLGPRDISGLKVADSLKQHTCTKVVFITEEKSYAVDAYEIGAYGFLLTPIDKKKFEKIISIVQENIMDMQMKQYLDDRKKLVI